ncbi:hypothetical protein ADUPG1_004908, partial [Aduncisulcus paluster]
LRNPLLSLIHHNDNCGPAIIPLLQEIHDACIALFKVADNTPLQASDTLVSSGSGFIVSSHEHKSWIKFQLRHWADTCLTSQLDVSEINPRLPSLPLMLPLLLVTPLWMIQVYLSPVSTSPQSSAPQVNQTSPGAVDSATHLSPAEEEILDLLEWAEEQ